MDVSVVRGAGGPGGSSGQRDVAEVETSVWVDVKHAEVMHRLLDDRARGRPQDPHARLCDLQMPRIVGRRISGRVEIKEGKPVAASEVGQDDRVARAGGR